jgi:hypothetical protein
VASRIDADVVHSCPHEDCEEGEHPSEDAMGWPLSARSLHDVQIVNGGQTTAAIYHCWKDGGMREQVEMLRVFAKVIVVGTGDHDEREELVSAIAKYSNTQNKVDPATLESNIPHFKSLEAAADSLSTPSGLRNFLVLRPCTWTLCRSGQGRGGHMESDAPSRPGYRQVRTRRHCELRRRSAPRCPKGKERLFLRLSTIA